MKRGYKLTEVGVIPEEWEVSLLRDLAQIRSGVAKNSNVTVNDPILVHYLRVANVQDGFLDLTEMSRIEISRNDLKRFGVLPGDVLMNEGGDLDKLGRGSIWQGQLNPCVHQNHVFVVRCGSRLLPEFLNIWSRNAAARRYFMVAGKQTTNLASINKTALGELPLALPPLPEQRAIATALSDVDALLSALARLITKKRDLKQAAMQQLLTGQTRLPGFEGEWEPTTLGEVATFTSGGTPSRGNDAYWDGEIPWISATSLRCFEIWRSPSNVTEEAVAAGSKIAPIDSTLLLVRGSALHNEILCGLVTKRVCFNQDVKALIPSSKIFPRFLTWLITGRADDFLKLVSSAGNTAGVLDTKQLKTFKFLLPGLPEQAAIATVLSDMDAELAVLEQRQAKTRAIKQGMMQELLTGRTRLV